MATIFYYITIETRRRWSWLQFLPQGQIHCQLLSWLLIQRNRWEYNKQSERTTARMMATSPTENQTRIRTTKCKWKDKKEDKHDDEEDKDDGKDSNLKDDKDGDDGNKSYRESANDDNKKDNLGDCNYNYHDNNGNRDKFYLLSCGMFCNSLSLTLSVQTPLIWMLLVEK